MSVGSPSLDFIATRAWVYIFGDHVVRDVTALVSRIGLLGIEPRRRPACRSNDPDLRHSQALHPEPGHRLAGFVVRSLRKLAAVVPKMTRQMQPEDAFVDVAPGWSHEGDHSAVAGARDVTVERVGDHEQSSRRTPRRVRYSRPGTNVLRNSTHATVARSAARTCSSRHVRGAT